MKVNPELKRFFKFTLFSISAGIIQFGVFTLLYLLLGTSKAAWWVAYLTGLVLSVLYNFTVNRAYTFRSAANIPIAMSLVAGYYAVFTPLSTYLGNRWEAAGMDGFVVTLTMMVANFVTEFLFCRFVVYRNQLDTGKHAPDNTDAADES